MSRTQWRPEQPGQDVWVWLTYRRLFLSLDGGDGCDAAGDVWGQSRLMWGQSRLMWAQSHLMWGQTGPNFSTFQAADLEISQETLAAAVSGCVDGCWEGFVKGREGGPSTTVPWRKERLDRLDGILAGGPTEEQEEQLSLTHRLHTNVHTGTQTQWCPGRLHAQPQNKAVHCSRRAPPDRRTKAGPQDGHRNRLCRKGLATGSNFNRHFGQLLSGEWQGFWRGGSPSESLSPSCSRLQPACQCPPRNLNPRGWFPLRTLSHGPHPRSGSLVTI